MTGLSPLFTSIAFNSVSDLDGARCSIGSWGGLRMAAAALALLLSSLSFSQPMLTCDTKRSSPVGIPLRRTGFFVGPLSSSASHSSYGAPSSGLPNFSAAYAK